jgi:hypothetical protein
VTHWRELRRLTMPQVADRPLLAAMRNAADLSDWYGFVVQTKRNPTELHRGVIDLKDGSGIASPLDWSDLDQEDADRKAAFINRARLTKPNAYGEVVPRTIGIKAAGEAQLYTRDTVWEIKAKRGGDSWMDKLRAMCETGTGWHITNACDLPEAALSSSISSSSPLGLVKNNCGSLLTAGEKEEIYQNSRRAYRAMRLNPHGKMNEALNERYPTWDSYENAVIDMMNHRAMSLDEWAAHQERTAIMLEGMR